MKNYIKIPFIIALLLCGCNDYLELQPLDQPSSATFYSNETEVTMAVNAAYNYLDADNTFGYEGYYNQLVHMGDAGLSRWSSMARPFRRGQVDPTLGEVEAYYADHYKGISVCNLAISGMEAARETMEADGKLDEWNTLRSEARVIRAWLYYGLVTKFGAVPFTEEQLASPAEYAELGRTPEDEIYQFIFDEISDAVQYLENQGAAPGRITRNAALAIGAKTALYRAFFSQGQAIAPDATYLALVRDWTQEIIDSGANALYYSGTDPKNSYRELFTYAGENSAESILQKEFNFVNGKDQSRLRLLSSRNLPGGFAAVTPQEYLIHTYEDTLGNTVDKSPYYSPKNPFFARDPRLYQTVILPRVEGSEIVEVVLNTANGPQVLRGYNEVSPGSPYPDAFNDNLIREFKSTLSSWVDPSINLDNFNWWTDANGIDHPVGNQDATNPFSSFTGYLTYKYVDFSDFPNNADNSSLNTMLIRYADVLLMNAEARIELNDNLELATQYMNMIRARAYGMALGEYLSHPSALNVGMGQEELRIRVRRERKVELAMEGHRYDDLKRYGATMKALNQVLVGRPKLFHLEDDSHIPVIDENAVVVMPWLNGLNPANPDFPNRGLELPDYKAHYDLWPIPQSQFDNGKALQSSDQNPGYLGSE